MMMSILQREETNNQNKLIKSVTSNFINTIDFLINEIPAVLENRETALTNSAVYRVYTRGGGGALESSRAVAANKVQDRKQGTNPRTFRGRAQRGLGLWGLYVVVSISSLLKAPGLSLIITVLITVMRTILLG